MVRNNHLTQNKPDKYFVSRLRIASIILIANDVLVYTSMRGSIILLLKIKKNYEKLLAYILEDLPFAVNLPPVLYHHSILSQQIFTFLPHNLSNVIFDITTCIVVCLDLA